MTKHLILNICLFLPFYIFGQSSTKIDSVLAEIKLNQDKVDSIEQIISSLEKIRKEEVLKQRMVGLEGGKGVETIAKVYSNWGAIKLREEPNGKVIKEIPIGSKITVYTYLLKHYKIKYKKYVGYVSSGYLKLDDNLKNQLIIEDEVSKKTLSTQKSYNSTSGSSSYTKSSSYKSSSSKRTWVKGDYRTLKSGKKVWVKGHYRG